MGIKPVVAKAKRKPVSRRVIAADNLAQFDALVTENADLRAAKQALSIQLSDAMAEASAKAKENKPGLSPTMIAIVCFCTTCAIGGYILGMLFAWAVLG